MTESPKTLLPRQAKILAARVFKYPEPVSSEDISVKYRLDISATIRTK